MHACGDIHSFCISFFRRENMIYEIKGIEVMLDSDLANSKIELRKLISQ